MSKLSKKFNENFMEAKSHGSKAFTSEETMTAGLVETSERGNILESLLMTPHCRSLFY